MVVTSVDRDDLADGGAEHFARNHRRHPPRERHDHRDPDAGFPAQGRRNSDGGRAKPDVFNHNLETVPSKYLTVRPGARYFASLRLLQQVKELDPQMFTKSGIMVGLGEERNEVLQLMDDLRAASVDFLTIGQYLQPSRKHHPVVRFIPPEEFKAYETIAYAKGFLMVSASPLTRSSHHAGEDFARLRAARAARASALVPKFSTKRRVKHSAEEMFALVADIEAYPKFLPMCEKLVIRGRSGKAGPRSPSRRHDNRVCGRAGNIHHRVTLDRPALSSMQTTSMAPSITSIADWSFVPEGEAPAWCALPSTTSSSLGC